MPNSRIFHFHNVSCHYDIRKHRKAQEPLYSQYLDNAHTELKHLSYESAIFICPDKT